jgi:hypothetical protein
MFFLIHLIDYFAILIDIVEDKINEVHNIIKIRTSMMKGRMEWTAKEKVSTVS